MANPLSQVKNVLVDISGTLQVEGGLTLKANIALNQSVVMVTLLASVFCARYLNGLCISILKAQTEH